MSQHGVDPTRLHILYKAPPSEVLEWEDHSLVGMQRWLAKVFKLAHAVESLAPDNLSLDQMDRAERDVYRETHVTIKQVTEAFSTTYSFNTAISDLIKLTNRIATSNVSPSSPVYQHAVRSLITMMAPMAPSTSEECWEAFNGKETVASIFEQPWPNWDEKALEKDTIECIIQVRRIKQTDR